MRAGGVGVPFALAGREALVGICLSLTFAAGEPFVRRRLRLFERGGDGLGLVRGTGRCTFGVRRRASFSNSRLSFLFGFGAHVGERSLKRRRRLGFRPNSYGVNGARLLSCGAGSHLLQKELIAVIGLCHFRANSLELGDGHVVGCGASVSCIADRRFIGMRAERRCVLRPGCIGLSGL